jgi:hypothetical protein
MANLRIDQLPSTTAPVSTDLIPLSHLIGTLNGNGGSITAGATTFTVSAAADTPSTPFPCVIDSEEMNVTNVAGTIWTVTRGYNGTTAATHTDGTVIKDTRQGTIASIFQGTSFSNPSATLHGTAAYAADVPSWLASFVNSLVFDGTTTYVKGPQLTFAQNANKLLFSCFCSAKLPTLPAVISTLVEQVDTVTNYGFQLSLSEYSNPGSVRASIHGTGGTVNIFSTVTVNDGAWHDVGFTINGAGQLTIYVDGVASGNGNVGSAANINISNSGSMTFGALEAGAGQFFTGKICNIRIYNGICLDQTTVTNMATGVPSGSALIGLTDWYKLNEGGSGPPLDYAPIGMFQCYTLIAGQGEASATTYGGMLRAPNAVGTNIPGAPLIIQNGLGSGNAATAPVIIQQGVPGSTGAVQHAKRSAVWIGAPGPAGFTSPCTGIGNFSFADPPADYLHIQGASTTDDPVAGTIEMFVSDTLAIQFSTNLPGGVNNCGATVGTGGPSQSVGGGNLTNTQYYIGAAGGTERTGYGSEVFGGITDIENGAVVRMRFQANGTTALSAGNSFSFATIPALLACQTANVMSIGTAETTLWAVAIPKNLVVTVGDRLDFTCTINLSSTATATKAAKVYFGQPGSLTTVYNSGALTSSAAGTLTLSGSIVFDSTTTAKVTVIPNDSGVSTTIGVTETDVSSLNYGLAMLFKVTGNAGGTGTANGDLTSKQCSMMFTPAPPTMLMYDGMTYANSTSMNTQIPPVTVATAAWAIVGSGTFTVQANIMQANTGTTPGQLLVNVGQQAGTIASNFALGSSDDAGFAGPVDSNFQNGYYSDIQANSVSIWQLAGGVATQRASNTGFVLADTYVNGYSWCEHKATGGTTIAFYCNRAPILTYIGSNAAYNYFGVQKGANNASTNSKWPSLQVTSP